MRIKWSKRFTMKSNLQTNRIFYFGSTFIKLGSLTRWISRPRSQVTWGASTIICSSSSCSSINSCSSSCYEKKKYSFSIDKNSEDIPECHLDHHVIFVVEHHLHLHLNHLILHRKHPLVLNFVLKDIWKW